MLWWHTSNDLLKDVILLFLNQCGRFFFTWWIVLSIWFLISTQKCCWNIPKVGIKATINQSKSIDPWAIEECTKLEVYCNITLIRITICSIEYYLKNKHTYLLGWINIPVFAQGFSRSPAPLHISKWRGVDQKYR
jgi:hypothetical protein